MLASILRYLPPPMPPPTEPVVRPRERIVAIGDSITQAGGYLRIIDAVFARQYPHLRLPPIVNAGVGGHKAEDMAARFDADVLAHSPDRVFINAGVNDVWHRLTMPERSDVLDAYRANVARMTRAALARGAHVLLLTPTLIGETAESEGNRRLSRYVDAMRAVAAETGAGLCDLHALFLAVLATAARPANWLTTDGVHMRPAGDAVMAIGVLRSLGVPDDRIAVADTLS